MEMRRTKTPLVGRGQGRPDWDDYGEEVEATWYVLLGFVLCGAACAAWFVLRWWFRWVIG